ncbi:MAG: methionyl-tRNA formyltransferase [Clostridia bacterium]|nr:methionyl-tRNA formyltransferase [Clostridia bacterium]
MQRVIFMGTPDFAVPSLQKLIENGFDIPLVVSQPDKPRGRSKQLVMPEVKVLALEHGIEVFQPESLKNEEASAYIASFEPDYLVVAAYGKILPKAVLDIPKKACINVHGSLLPKYRGAAPIQWAVLNGEHTTGVTTMLMGEGLDTGDMLLKREVTIGENETAAALFDRLAEVGADLLMETLAKFDSITPEAQNDAEASYSPMIDRSLCPIDWSLPAIQIHNKVRGLAEWPVALTALGSKNLKIHEGRVAGVTDKAPGTVIDNHKKLIIACGEHTSYEILSLQLEGKKRMSSDAFLLGHKIELGERLG